MQRTSLYHICKVLVDNIFFLAIFLSYSVILKLLSRLDSRWRTNHPKICPHPYTGCTKKFVPIHFRFNFLFKLIKCIGSISFTPSDGDEELDSTVAFGTHFSAAQLTARATMRIQNRNGSNFEIGRIYTDTHT